jgi:hypothetical protein
MGLLGGPGGFDCMLELNIPVPLQTGLTPIAATWMEAVDLWAVVDEKATNFKKTRLARCAPRDGSTFSIYHGIAINPTVATRRD